MKILIFNTLYYPNQLGGAEKSVQLLAEGLVKKGEEVVVVTTSNKEYIDYVNGVKVYYLKINNLYWPYISKEQNKIKKPLWHLIDSYNIFNPNKIDQIIKKENPDVIHTNNLAGFSVIVWKIAKKYNKKIVHTLRDYYLLCPKSTMYKNDKNCKNQCLDCKLLSIPKKNYSKYVDVVVGISEFILNRHKEFGYFPNAKIETVIYNSVEVPKVNIKKENKKEIILGFVGRIEKAKGIEFLLEKFSRLKLENVKLFIYGRGLTKEYESEIKQKYESSQILFKGFKKPEEIYNEIDILIVPSLWNEPFGRIVPEANSYGVPVLVSNRGGLPELVEEGKNGYMFDPDKEGDFEEKLKKIIEMKKNSSCNFDNKEKFSLENIINKFMGIYNVVT